MTDWIPQVGDKVVTRPGGTVWTVVDVPPGWKPAPEYDMVLLLSTTAYIHKSGLARNLTKVG